MPMRNGEGALMYAWVTIADPTLAPIEVPPLSGYSAAMVVALQQLDSAIVVANRARAAVTPPLAGSAGFLPVEWMRTATAPTSFDNYIRLVRSTKARFRAGVARNATERAAVNWNEVVNDAANGITSDWVLDLSNNAGWRAQWLSQMAVASSWSAMRPAITGMAAT